MESEEQENSLASEATADSPLDRSEVSVPTWLRLAAVAFFLVLLVLSIFLFAKYLCDPTVEGLAPDKLGLPYLISFSVIGGILFMIPWGRYGLRIKKVGPIEFQEILSTQADEHTKEIVELREQISSLRNLKSEGENYSDTAYGSIAQPPSLELRRLLITFLTEYQHWAFSPIRVQYWGSQQPNFEKLNDFKVDEIRYALQSMVAEGKLETRISKKGNTLYRIRH